MSHPGSLGVLIFTDSGIAITENARGELGAARSLAHLFESAQRARTHVQYFGGLLTGLDVIDGSHGCSLAPIKKPACEGGSVAVVVGLDAWELFSHFIGIF